MLLGTCFAYPLKLARWLEMLDDNKHDTPIAVRLTDREAHDVLHECARLDKKPAEMLRYAFRLYMYGRVGMQLSENKKNESAE